MSKLSSKPPIQLGEHALYLWCAHYAMSKSSTDSAIVELGEISEAYAIAIEIVASSASRSTDKFAAITLDTSRRDAILTGYIVGLTLVEHAILGGYSAQAAALVRQELEAIAALEELRLGKRKDGKTPNFRHVPSIPGTIYGDLSKAAHFSDTPTLRLLSKYRGEVPEAPGPIEMWLLSPQHVPNTTRQLFALHTLLLLQFAEYQSAHYSELHGSEHTEDERIAVEKALDSLRRAGVVEST